MDVMAPIKKVVYLFGAGASHACVSRVRSDYGILMSHLNLPMREGLRDLVEATYSQEESLQTLVNTLDESTDFEHLCTFLEEAPSVIHRQFGQDMKRTFEKVLRSQLNLIREENDNDPVELYAVLLDLYNIKDCTENLHGILTTNYDEYIETAMEKLVGLPVDLGVRVLPSPPQGRAIRLLKLHGSLGWAQTWPITRGEGGQTTVWIPPGIQKAKTEYPFNVLWGLAREMLSCDVLRVVGCRLGPNDWDLVSLLFTMRHADFTSRPRIEVIDAPVHAEELKKSYPYLDIQSIFELETVGQQLVGELSAGLPRELWELSIDEREELINNAGTGSNWFELWLRQKAESFQVELGAVETKAGFVERFLEIR